VTQSLIDIDPHYPAVSAERREQLLVVKGELEAQAPAGAPGDPFAAKRAKRAMKKAKAKKKAHAKQS
jgi:hypothetical protein